MKSRWGGADFRPKRAWCRVAWLRQAAPAAQFSVRWHFAVGTQPGKSGTNPALKVSQVRLVAESFSWPLRGAWPARFAIGALTVLLLPIAFIPLLAYAIAATRSAEAREAPPPWRFSIRLLFHAVSIPRIFGLLSAPLLLSVGL